MANGIVGVTRNEVPVPMMIVQIDNLAAFTDNDGIATFLGIPHGESRLTIRDQYGYIFVDRMVVIKDGFSFSEEV